MRFRFFGRRPDFRWQPRQLGPRFEWTDHDHIIVRQGPLADLQFELKTEVQEKTASGFLLYDGETLGQVLIERDPPGRGVTLWDIGVREDLRRSGLASILTYVIFRELLALQKTATFRIRMITSVKPGDTETELRNVGICVIGNRLGFSSEFDLATLLRPDNVTGVRLIPARGGFPPGFKFEIRTYPLVLVAFILDQDTQKPVFDFGTYVRVSRDQALVQEWVKQGLIVVSNGNFLLRSEGVNRFVNRLATDEEEAQRFRRRVRGL